MEDSTRQTQLQGPCCPSAPVMSSDSVADSHWPRDINLSTLSPCLRQPWLMHKHEVGMGVMLRVLHPPGEL
jgi:hypothetical protein